MLHVLLTFNVLRDVYQGLCLLGQESYWAYDAKPRLVIGCLCCFIGFSAIDTWVDFCF
jgi:hypothetical protein